MSRFSQSRFAAWLQNKVSERRLASGLYHEIEAQLPPLETGRLVDVGSGSALQLQAIHEVRPAVELFGLDLSAAAIDVARRNLTGMPVDLRVGSIEQAPYGDSYFDIVTCNASMSYWKDPVACFDEIYRILELGGSGVLFEPQQDPDLHEVLATVDRNLAGAGPLRRFAARSLNTFPVRESSPPAGRTAAFATCAQQGSSSTAPRY